jgi:peptidoglycan/xylan/chitin deacetylase (PgdA/CDA1 family)
MELTKRWLAVLLLLAVGNFGIGSKGIPLVSSASENSVKRVALTFDDGPSARYTSDILDFLSENHIKATFFVIGVNAKEYPELIQREASEGHDIGNHTYTHPHLKGMDSESLTEELKRTEETVKNICGIRTVLFRPPEGVCSDAVRTAEKRMGYRQVLWTIDTRDWAHNSRENMVNIIQKQVKNGSIILFHDYVAGESHTLETIKQIVPWLLENGYEFVKVSDFLP